MKNIKFLFIALLLFVFSQSAALAANYSEINNLKTDAKQAGIQTAAATKDAAITALVKSKLLTDSRTHGLAIKVITENNVVTLSGEVANFQEKAAAEQIAAQTADVKAVVNNLVIQ